MTFHDNSSVDVGNGDRTSSRWASHAGLTPMHAVASLDQAATHRVDDQLGPIARRRLSQ